MVSQMEPPVHTPFRTAFNELVKPSVAQKMEKATAAPGVPNLGPNDPFYEFFRRFQAPGPQGPAPMHGLGSGFIVSPIQERPRLS